MQVRYAYESVKDVEVLEVGIGLFAFDLHSRETNMIEQLALKSGFRLKLSTSNE